MTPCTRQVFEENKNKKDKEIPLIYLKPKANQPPPVFEDVRLHPIAKDFHLAIGALIFSQFSYLQKEPYEQQKFISQYSQKPSEAIIQVCMPPVPFSYVVKVAMKDKQKEFDSNIFNYLAEMGQLPFRTNDEEHQKQEVYRLAFSGSLPKGYGFSLAKGTSLSSPYLTGLELNRKNYTNGGIEWKAIGTNFSAVLSSGGHSLTFSMTENQLTIKTSSVQLDSTSHFFDRLDPKCWIFYTIWWDSKGIEISHSQSSRYLNSQKLRIDWNNGLPPLFTYTQFCIQSDAKPLTVQNLQFFRNNSTDSPASDYSTGNYSPRGNSSTPPQLRSGYSPRSGPANYLLRSSSSPGYSRSARSIDHEPTTCQFLFEEHPPVDTVGHFHRYHKFALCDQPFLCPHQSTHSHSQEFLHACEFGSECKHINEPDHKEHFLHINSKCQHPKQCLDQAISHRMQYHRRTLNLQQNLMTSQRSSIPFSRQYNDSNLEDVSSLYQKQTSIPFPVNHLVESQLLKISSPTFLQKMFTNPTLIFVSKGSSRCIEICQGDHKTLKAAIEQLAHMLFIPILSIQGEDKQKEEMERFLIQDEGPWWSKSSSKFKSLWNAGDIGIRCCKLSILG